MTPIHAPDRSWRAAMQLAAVGVLTAAVVELIGQSAQAVLDEVPAPPAWIAVLAAAVALALIGVTAALWLSKGMNRAADSLVRLRARLGPARWILALLGLLFAFWLFLYSPWQAGVTVSLPGPWTHLVLHYLLAQVVGLLAADEPVLFTGRRESLLAAALLLVTMAVPEARLNLPFPAVYRGLTALGGLLLLLVFALLYRPALFARAGTAFAKWPGWLPGLLAIPLALTPVIYRYAAGAEFYAGQPWLRLSLLAVALAALTPLIAPRESRLSNGRRLFVAAGLLALSSALAGELLAVNSYPFSLSWSEGNRFWDYSLIFARSLYQYDGVLSPNYFSPGRYALWGLPFLIPDLPVWAHRLWNATLWVGAPLLTAAALARALRHRPDRRMMLPWAALFIMLGPVYPPLLLAAALTLAFAFSDRWPLKLLAVIAASVYAGLSRWTWAAAPGAWLALIDLLVFYPQREGNRLRRFLPALGWGLAGSLPGMLASWNGVFATSGDFAFSQPLLWYRLWPNPTFATGILLGILIAAGPLIGLLAWRAGKAGLRLDWIQALALFGGLAVLFAVGLPASVKIGGGGNLHNFDMFLVTLAIAAGLLVQRQPRRSLSGWPGWARALALLALGVPLVSMLGAPALPQMAADWRAVDALNVIHLEIDRLPDGAPILFMDQRQLLTFGQVTGVTLIPDYEKKYMTDQAMGNNEPYFLDYYRALADRRFALIITQPLKLHYEGRARSFSDENDAWVYWVVEPTLCYYEPIATYEDVGVQLLVPRADTAACAHFLEGR